MAVFFTASCRFRRTFNGILSANLEHCFSDTIPSIKGIEEGKNASILYLGIILLFIYLMFFDMGVRSGKSVVRIVFGVMIVLVFCGISTAQKVPANFVFGDSLVEAGNNNYIASLSKCNYVPFGIDFGGHPTGRFTNGRTIADIIGQEVGFEDFTPPYMAPTTTGNVILKGVNYASGGGGICNETGYIFGGRFNMDEQIDYFANTRQDIISSIGGPAARKLLKTALVAVTIGANDFINNYLTPVLSTPVRETVSPEKFVAFLIARFRFQLMRLYNLGARKIVVSNVGPIGCIPYQRDQNPSAGENCAAFPSHLAQMFNSRLKNLVPELRKNLKGSEFVYADVYRIVYDIILNYKSYGFQNSNTSCCKLAGRFGGLIPCGPPSDVCLDRSKYVFWDPYHPTDAANVIIAKRLMDGGSDDIWPVNIRQLVQSSTED